MPLSISSSEERAAGRSYSRPIAWALATLALLLCGFEATTRLGFPRISHIESRIFKDHAAALAVRHRKDSRASILLLGNSLLLEGLDYDRIRSNLEKEAVPTRFVIEQTSWLDWYYGIRRLLAEGSRPDRIVLCLDIGQLLSNAIRGEYSAFHLIRAADLVAAGSSAGYNLSGISTLFFAHYSLYFADVNNFRNFVLNKVAPSYAADLRGFAMAPPPVFTDAQVLAITSPRLAGLQSMCSEYHIRCDILMPPRFGPPGEAGLIEAGKRSGTTILVPVPADTWGNEMYRSDRYHLNPEGAERFTDLLAAALRQP